MKVSIIVATTGQRPITARALRSMLQQDFASEEYELILVLDGCKEPEWCAAERRNARCRFVLLPQPRQGKAACVNAGLRAACGEIALFLDDDILCPPDLISQHVDAHDRQPGHLAFGPILTSQESSESLATVWMRDRIDSWFERQDPNPGSQGWCFAFSNPNTSASRSLLLSAGALDGSFRRYNDVEFGFRLWKQGMRFVYLPDVPVFHVAHESITELVRKRAREMGPAEVRLCRKHPEYRAFTVLGGLSCESTARNARRRALIAACRLAEAILGPMTQLADALRRVPLIRRAGLRLIAIRFTAHFFRGAIEECGSWKAFQNEFGQRLPVLVYHRVGEAQPGEWYGLTISKGRLEAHLRWLKRSGWNSITAAQWLQWLETAAPLPEKPVLLSFDDGFADNLANAFLPLQHHGFVAMNAVVTGLLGDVSRWESASRLPEYKLMNADEVRRWAAAGMEFASHSRSHPHLPALSEEQLADELALSRAELAAITGAESNVLVYPYGECDDRVCDEAARHYKLGFALDGGLNSLGQHPMRLRRIVISESDTPLDLWFYTNLGSHPLKAIRRRLGNWAARLKRR